jgi:hypothetical protein
VVTTTVRHFTAEARTVTTGLHHFSPVPTATTFASIVQESIRRTAALGSTASLFEAFSNLPRTSFHRARHIQERDSAPCLARGNEHHKKGVLPLSRRLPYNIFLYSIF